MERWDVLTFEEIRSKSNLQLMSSSKIVELWNQPVPLSNDYARAFAIELPQNYYVYRDNHHYLRQTRIGLLLDKETLQPLAKRLSAEAGVIEPLDLSPGKEGALKREWGRYRQRDLLVTIKGSMPGYPDSSSAPRCVKHNARRFRGSSRRL